jgi:DNA-3-methyladenine glycosylase I
MFSAGLSFAAILEKEANLRKAFDNFDYNIIVSFDAEKIDELMVDSEIIRNLKK